MFANWLTIAFYIQTSILAHAYDSNKNHVNLSWLYLTSFAAICLHIWIITTSASTNQVSLYIASFSIFTFIIAYIMENNNFIKIAFPIAACLTLIETISLSQNNLQITIHIATASMLISSVIVAGIQAIAIVRQRLKLKQAKPPLVNLPALEVLESQVQLSARIGLVLVTLTILSSTQKILTLALSFSLISNLILTIITWLVLATIASKRYTTMAKSKNGIMILFSIVLLALVSFTCILLRT
ncbi:MAG: hypothetical protein VX335_04685 [Pseudomonadota bacterium]|nr:hypothetical protein [Pseudomonadota bacterium]